MRTAKDPARLLRLGHLCVGAGNQREPVSERLAREWHRVAFEGTSVPYPGSFRGDDRWFELEHWEVQVGVNNGLSAASVHAAIGEYFHVLRYFLVGLDQLVWPDEKPRQRELGQIVRMAAWAHGEWIRIHPFTDGNGTIARAWARFVFARYQLPPVIELGSSSRPDDYVRAAVRSMAERNHHSTTLLFTRLLAEQLGVD